MKKTFLDTETNSFTPGQICQLTYVICDDDRVKKSKNFFLMVDDMAESASNVHGFTIDKLKELSHSQRFKDIYEEVAADLYGTVFIAHNVNFDKKFVNAEFMRLPEIEWQPSDYFCTMEYFKPIVKAVNSSGRLKNPKLEEVMNFLKINPDTVLKGAAKLFGSGDITFHDARYDVATMVSCYYRGLKLGYTDRLSKLKIC